MKQTTKDWLLIAEEDLLAAKKLSQEEHLSNLVSFHCQQGIEKYFKAVIEELARYPGDLGLLPHGKPLKSDIEAFIHFRETLLNRLKNQLKYNGF